MDNAVDTANTADMDNTVDTEQKTPREVDLRNCREIGRGQCSTVCQISEDRVVKLFFNTVSRGNIEKELAMTMEGNRLGIHAAKCYGLVTSDGRLGMELEYIRGTTLREAVCEAPDRLEEYARSTALELQQIHAARPDPRLFPDVRDFYLHCIQGCETDGYITSEEAEALRLFVRCIPACPGMVHGDYHILNLMQQDGAIRLIDLADCMTGHPIYDLLVFHMYMHTVPLTDPELCRKLVGLPSRDLLRFNEVFIRTYFSLSSPAAFDRIEDILDVYCALKMMLAPYSFSNMHPEEGRLYVQMGRQKLMPVIEKYRGIIPEDIRELAR